MTLDMILSIAIAAVGFLTGWACRAASRLDRG